MYALIKSGLNYSFESALVHVCVSVRDEISRITCITSVGPGNEAPRRLMEQSIYLFMLNKKLFAQTFQQLSGRIENCSEIDFAHF